MEEILMNKQRYIDCIQECNTCGKQFIIRVYEDGSYDYLTETCECESGFSPVDGEISISQAVETLQPIA